LQRVCRHGVCLVLLLGEPEPDRLDMAARYILGLAGEITRAGLSYGSPL
jgi:hypothetical protein